MSAVGAEPRPTLDRVEGVVRLALGDRVDASVLVAAFATSELFDVGSRVTHEGGLLVTASVDGHLEHGRATTRRPLELDDPRWNDVEVDVAVLEPEPNHWTASRLLAASCAVRAPHVLVVVLPRDPELRVRDAYAPGSPVPALRRPETTIGWGGRRPPGDAGSALHYAVDAGGPRNGVLSAVEGFVRSSAGAWSSAERDGVAWLLHAEAPAPVRERFEEAARAEARAIEEARVRDEAAARVSGAAGTSREVEDRIAALERRCDGAAAARDEALADRDRARIQLAAAIRWQARLRDEGDRLRDEVRRLRTASGRAATRD